MSVRYLVGGEVLWIDPSSPMRDAVKLMDSADLGSLAVGSGGRLIGIITERDVLRACAGDGDLDRDAVEDWMTGYPDSIDPDMSVESASSWMLAANYRHLPLVEGVEVIGMISMKDLLWALTPPKAV